MDSEDTNPVIEAIKKNNLQIDATFLREIDYFKKAFEEDSVDE